MKITKLGHCCLLIEEKGLRVLTDPGVFSTAQNELKNIDVVLITHEHTDHVHIESLKKVLENNPKARVMTNKAVGKILEGEKINYELVEDGDRVMVGAVSIEGSGTQHAEIYKTIPSVLNTGYFIADRLWYPGDSFHNPHKVVEILALPVAGPWMKISEAIDYALLLKPKVCFPVHDGILIPAIRGLFGRVSGQVLQQANIKFIPLDEGNSYDFDA